MLDFQILISKQQLKLKMLSIDPNKVELNLASKILDLLSTEESLNMRNLKNIPRGIIYLQDFLRNISNVAIGI